MSALHYPVKGWKKAPKNEHILQSVNASLNTQWRSPLILRRSVFSNCEDSEDKVLLMSSSQWRVWEDEALTIMSGTVYSIISIIDHRIDWQRCTTTNIMRRQGNCILCENDNWLFPIFCVNYRLPFSKILCFSKTVFFCPLQSHCI